MNNNCVIEIGTFNIEVMPQFVGGREALSKYLSDRETEYKDVVNSELSGTVVVAFWVNIDGTIEGPEVTRSVDPELDRLSLQLITAMPEWLPAIRREQPIRCKFVLPIVFKRGKFEPFTRPIPSKYWSARGRRKLSKICQMDFGLGEEVVCECWYSFVIWNYNNRRVRDLDLTTLYEHQGCGL
ncbi:MAG: energy transducer TonB [Saprospiraceae bacterium]|nr:energy transducer TonB [Saprospiraceae bacterium]